MMKAWCYRLMGLTVLLAAWAAGAANEALVITKAGTSFWVTDANWDGDTLNYTARDGGEQATMPKAQVEQVLPRVKRGTTYNQANIAKVIEAIQKADRQFPKLKKQIQSLLQEWKALQREVEGASPEKKAETEKKIAQLVEAYEKGPKTTLTYGETVAALEFIKYQDLQQVFTVQIEHSIEDLRQDYLAVTTARLQEQAAKGETSVAAFIEARDTRCKMLSAKPSEEQLKLTEEAVAKYRQRTVAAALGRADNLWVNSQNLDGYLSAVAALDPFYRFVAAAGQQEDIRKYQGKLQGIVKTTIRDLSFDVEGLEGYPIVPADLAVLKRAGQYLTRASVSGLRADYGLVFPDQPPPELRVGKGFALRFDIILRMMPPAINGAIVYFGLNSVCYKFSPLRMQNGHAFFVLDYDWPGIDEKTVADVASNDDGFAGLLVAPAHWGKGVKEGEESWFPLTPASVLPVKIRAARPKPPEEAPPAK